MLKSRSKIMAACLKRIIGATQTGAIQPIYATVLLELSDGRATMTASDGEVQLSAPFEGKGDKPLKTCLSARTLSSFLQALEDMPIEMKKSKKDDMAEVVCGGTKSNLRTMEASEFSLMGEGKDVRAAFSIESGAMRRLVDLTSYSMGIHSHRRNLNGAFLKVDEKCVTMVATDGHRLACARIDEVKPGKEIDGVILPRKAIVELGKNLNDGDPLQVEIGDDFARFSSDTFTLTTILVDEEFPSYKRVIPMSNSAVATASREAMQACLRRVCALSNKNGAVKWRVEPAKLQMEATNDDNEKTSEELVVEYDGESFDIAFNHSFLTEVLEAFRVDTVRLEMKDGASSMLLRGGGESESDSFRYVVMPMRV